MYRYIHHTYVYYIQTASQPAAYLVSLDDGLQTMLSFIINQLVVDLCQTLQHLPKKSEVTLVWASACSAAEGLEDWPDPPCDRLWKCWPCGAAWRWGAGPAAGGHSPPTRAKTLLEVSSAAGWPRPGSAPCIVWWDSCQEHTPRGKRTTTHLDWHAPGVEDLGFRTNLYDSDSLSIKSWRILLTSAPFPLSEPLMLSLVIRSSNDNIVLPPYASPPCKTP